MGFAIFLRENKQISYFQRSLVSLLSFPDASRAVLCSGYFSEGANYSISREILSTRLAVNSFELVGGMFSWGRQNQSRYQNFVRTIRHSGRAVTAYSALNKRWHAKIALVLDTNNNPIGTLVGSSNLTRPAFDEGFSSFNHEADVLIWLERNDITAYFDNLLRKLKTISGKNSGPIKLVLDEEFHQPNEEKRLRELSSLIEKNKGTKMEF